MSSFRNAAVGMLCGVAFVFPVQLAMAQRSGPPARKLAPAHLTQPCKDATRTVVDQIAGFVYDPDTIRGVDDAKVSLRKSGAVCKNAADARLLAATVQLLQLASRRHAEHIGVRNALLDIRDCADPTTDGDINMAWDDAGKSGKVGAWRYQMGMCESAIRSASNGVSLGAPIAGCVREDLR